MHREKHHPSVINRVRKVDTSARWEVNKLFDSDAYIQNGLLKELSHHLSGKKKTKTKHFCVGFWLYSSKHPHSIVGLYSAVYFRLSCRHQTVVQLCWWMTTYQYSYGQSTRAPLLDPLMCGEACANSPLSLTSFSSLGGAEWSWVERARGFMNCITTAGFGWGTLMEQCGAIASKYYSARRSRGLVNELCSKTVEKGEKRPLIMYCYYYCSFKLWMNDLCFAVTNLNFLCCLIKHHSSYISVQSLKSVVVQLLE